jgi:hypothetical protein
MLLGSLRHRRVLFRRSNARLLPAGRRIGLLRSHPITLLWLSLFLAIRSIMRRRLLRPNLPGPLLLGLLAISGLLTTGR